MIRIHRAVVFGAALLFGVVGCADLAVENQNEPDAGRALGTAGDIESLIGGSYMNWYLANGAYEGMTMALGNMAFEYGSSAANAGAVFYSSIPRPEVVNGPSGTYYPNLAWVYERTYRALAAVSSGLNALEDPEIADELGSERVRRARAFGKFVQGLGHATLAVMFDKAFIIDETSVTIEDGVPVFTMEPSPYSQVMEAALDYFDEAIAIAKEGSFTIPVTWMSVEVSSDELIRLAHSMKARYRAAVARSPQEREAVDWRAVLADVEAGITGDFETDIVYVRSNWHSDMAQLYMSQYGASWAFTMYWIEGMADTSGLYQEWLSLPVGARHPQDGLSKDFLIQTPDLRFPKGATIEEQAANPGKYYRIVTNSEGKPIFTSQWARPDRGTWRWSFYDDTESRAHNAWLHGTTTRIPEVLYRSQRLLAAEAHYWLGDLDLAANIINETRTENGLNATDASGTNTSCVPKLPNGDCGDLFEMLKWEKRMESKLLGIMHAEGFFDSRGWGDLYRGTALHFPIPGVELQTLNLPAYTFGGGGEGSSPGSSYAWPGEM